MAQSPKFSCCLPKLDIQGVTLKMLKIDCNFDNERIPRLRQFALVNVEEILSKSKEN